MAYKTTYYSSFAGRIVNVTSVKGRIANPHDVGYCVTKYAAEAFSDILRREMYKFGVNVSVIEPGYFHGATGMLDQKHVSISRIRNHPIDSLYTVESVNDTVPVIERIFGAKVAR